MSRDNQTKPSRAQVDEYVNDLAARGFLLVVRVRRDGKREFKCAPGTLEWLDAVTLYRAARDEDAVTEAHRQRVRKAWRALDGRVRWSDDDRAFLREALDFQ